MARARLLKTAVVLLLILAGSSALALGGRYWWTTWRYLETTDDAYVEGEITPVIPKVAGYVQELRVTDHQPVKAGDILLRIDDHEFRLAVDQAKARLEATRAALASARSRLELQETLIAQASAGVAAAEAELERADKEFQRARDLLRSRAGTRARFDEARAARRKAEAMLEQARMRLQAERQQVRILEAERSRLEAAVDSDRAALALARTRLADTIIKAPVSGIVGNRAVRDGQYVRPGTLLMAIVPLDGVWIEANYKETQLTRMHVGQPAEIAVDSFPDVTIRGHVQSFSPASGAEFSLLPPENATGNFTKIVQRIPVKIVIDGENPLHGRLRPGMSVEVTVDTRSRREPITASAPH